MVEDRSDAMTTACCANPADCETGAPTRCSEDCSDVLEPYFEICSGWIAGDTDFGAILQPLIGMCEEAKFGAYSGSLFSHRCSTAGKRQYLSTTLPAACCGEAQENCPEGATFPPLPARCTQQCAATFETFYADCRTRTKSHVGLDDV